MKAEKVIEILKLLEGNGLHVVLDGGWGVDALLGKQTRPHNDLDIAIPHKEVTMLRRLLCKQGFADIPREDTKPYNFVLGDSEGNLLDVHSYTFDENGNNNFGIAYLPEDFTGNGMINGHPVKCISAGSAVKFHSVYEPGQTDYADVFALCIRYKIPLPESFKRFKSGIGREISNQTNHKTDNKNWGI